MFINNNFVPVTGDDEAEITTKTSLQISPWNQLKMSRSTSMEYSLEQMINNMPPANQLKLAVASNMTDLLDRALTATVDLNYRGYDSTGNTLLHLASKRGYHECVRKLLQAGANPDEPNVYGLTPLSVALRHGHVQCVKLLYETGSLLSDPRMVWVNHNSLEGVPMWADYNVSLMLLLLIATPALSELGPAVLKNLWEHQLQSLHSLQLIRMYVLTGNRLSQDQLAHLMTKAEGEVATSLRSLQGVQSLQHYARVAIRRCLMPNTLWASQQLPLPAKLQQYLLFDEDA